MAKPLGGEERIDAFRQRLPVDANTGIADGDEDARRPFFVVRSHCQWVAVNVRLFQW